MKVLFLTKSLLWGCLIVFSMPDSLRIKSSDSYQQTAITHDAYNLVVFLRVRKLAQCVVVDIRERDAFDYGHIAGAINLPTAALTREPKEQLLGLNQYSEVILYHAGRGNSSLELYAQKLRRAGVTAKISFYQNGWMEWKTCGLPVQKQLEQ